MSPLSSLSRVLCAEGEGRNDYDDIASWLRGLGLERYEQAFRDNEIDERVLPELTADDLKELGMTAVGHRRLVLNAIADLVDAGDHAAADDTSAVAPIPAPAEAERRQLTIMFSDLVGSTALSTQTDPEELSGLIGRYHRCVAECVQRFGGFIAKYMGDGVLAYFGYPRAQEEDPALAIHAGLAILDAVAGLPGSGEPKWQVRIGVATGPVVVGELIGEGIAQERSVVGETPNLAARLQGLASPGTIAICALTHRLAGRLFNYRDLGRVRLEGFAEPVRAWQPTGASGIESRFEARQAHGLTPLVGRDEELDLLRRRWQQAMQGEGRVVLISGEPGIGKSRLVAALHEQLASEPHVRLRYFCSPHHTDSALHPFITQLERAAGFAHDDTPAAKLDKIGAVFAGATGEDIALVAELLSVSGGNRYAVPDMTPQRKKELTLRALHGQLEALAARQPVLMVFEDAHWADPTSRELLDRTIEQTRALPVLLLVTYRPEFQPPWVGQAHVTAMTLNRLGERDGAALVERVVGKALPEPLLAQIVARADGVPLFVEELTKTVLESGLIREEERGFALDGPLPALAIPATLQASLVARLDRLSAVKEVAQTAAAIGRDFSHALIAAVSSLPKGTLDHALAQLVEAGLVFRRGEPPDATYIFKHALVQDAAYGTLLRGPRQQLHARIAAALETHSPELMDSQPELFAQHYAEAGLVEKAVVYWGKAGHRSASRSSMAEAVAQLQKGLDQLALLPDSDNRHRQELEFYSALGAAVTALKGFADRETGQVYARARKLWEQLGSPAEFLGIPHGQAAYHAYRGELEVALRLVEDLLRLSGERNDSAGLVLSHYRLGVYLTYGGRFVAARSHLEEALRLYNPISDRPHVHQVEFHPQVVAQAFLGIVLFCLGFPDQALVQSRAAVTIARTLDHPPSLAVSLSMGARVFWQIGNDAALGRQVDELLAVTTEQGFGYWHAMGRQYLGWIKVRNGELAEGLQLLRSIRAVDLAAGRVRHDTLFLLLANACEIAGEVEEAMTLLEEVLQIVERGERWFAAELNRHKGELLLRQGHSAAAEEFYRKALGIAEEQGAKLWELRAAASLARLRRDQGRRDEARDILAPIYCWFSEGFDTVDLQEAKALLNELAWSKVGSNAEAQTR